MKYFGQVQTANLDFAFVTICGNEVKGSERQGEADQMTNSRLQGIGPQVALFGLSRYPQSLDHDAQCRGTACRPRRATSPTRVGSTFYLSYLRPQDRNPRSSLPPPQEGYPRRAFPRVGLWPWARRRSSRLISEIFSRRSLTQSLAAAAQGERGESGEILSFWPLAARLITRLPENASANFADANFPLSY